MKISQFRVKAREKLEYKWIKSALLTLTFLLITYIIAFILNLVPIFGAITSVLLIAPLSYGFLVSLFKINNDTEVSFFDFLNNGLINFGKVWNILFHIILKLILPFFLIAICVMTFSYGIINQNTSIIFLGLVLYIVALIYAIIKQYSYKLAFYVFYDNPEMSGKEAVEKSAELMQGNIGALFCLDLSFVGWAFLSIFTLGIGLLWLIPYQQISQISFYRDLTGE